MVLEFNPILVPLLISSESIVNPPIAPALAVTVPCIVTLPELSKWKLLELISTKPFEPLTNWPPPPKKKLEELIVVLNPSNWILGPADFPTRKLPSPST